MHMHKHEQSMCELCAVKFRKHALSTCLRPTCI